MAPVVFQTQIQVKPEHLDHFQHVNNVQYLKWVNHAAHLHWEQETSKEQREKYTWMVIKHQIDYKKQAFLNDELILKTWVDKFTHVASIRSVQILRADDHSICASAQSKWCFLDKANLKPMRIPQDIKEPFIESEDV